MSKVSHSHNNYSKNYQNNQGEPEDLRKVGQRRIQPDHYQEWRDSGVAPEITELNVQSLDGSMGEDAPIEKICYAHKRLSTRQHGGYPKYVLKQYGFTGIGGWWVDGVDPETGQDSQWGQFKCDRPRIELKNGKESIRKYEAPPKVPSEAIFLRITVGIGLKIARKAGLEEEYVKRILPENGQPTEESQTLEEIRLLHPELLKTEDRGFWPWAIAVNLPICITEGAKKAGALLTAGVAGISIPGIFNGCPALRDSFGEKTGVFKLISQLQLFATEGREITIAFDNDSKSKTRINVRKATGRTGKLFADEGCEVTVFTWEDTSHKGIDDLISAVGEDEFNNLWENRQSLKDYNLQGIDELQVKLRSLTIKPDLELTEDDLFKGQYLPTKLLVNSIPLSGILNLKSFKGSGKSHFVKSLIEKHRKLGYKIISIVPRIVLGRGQAKDWGLEWDVTYEDAVSRKVLCKTTLYEQESALGITFDSLWKLAQREPSKTLIILDETELGLTHLLSSSTCKENRSRLLKTFEKLIHDCLEQQGLVVTSDADLTNISVDYIQALAPENTPTYTITTTAKLAGYQAKIYKQKKWLKQEILNALDADERIIIATDSQKQAEKLDRELSDRYPNKKIDRIDRTTTESDYGRDYVERLNESIKKERPDVLIYSPSMSTGASLDGKIDGEIDEEVKHWFDKVFGIFTGVITPSQARQSLMRYRELVPRHIFIKGVGMNHSGCKSFLPDEINQNFQDYHSEGLNMVDVVKSIEADDPQELIEKLQAMVNPETRQWSNPHVDAYCKFKARDNYGRAHLRDLFIQELEAEGHSVEFIEEEKPLDPSDELAAERQQKVEDSMEAEKAIGEAIAWEEAEGLVEAETITLEEAQRIKRKPNATKDELRQASKAFLVEELPGVALTREFVHKMVVKDQRRSLNAIKLYWKLTNPDATLYQDQKEYDHKFRQFAEHETVFLPDIKAYGPIVEELIILGILDAIDLSDPDKAYTSDSPELLEFKQKCLFRRNSIKQKLNIGVSKDSNPLHLANRFLEKIGLKLKCVERKREGNTKIRIYKIDQEILNDPDRLAVLNALDSKWGEIQSSEGLEGGPQLSKSLRDKQKSELWPGRLGHDKKKPKTKDIADGLASCQTYEELFWWVNRSGLSRLEIKTALDYLSSRDRRWVEKIAEDKRPCSVELPEESSRQCNRSTQAVEGTREEETLKPVSKQESQRNQESVKEYQGDFESQLVYEDNDESAYDDEDNPYQELTKQVNNQPITFWESKKYPPGTNVTFKHDNRTKNGVAVKTSERPPKNLEKRQPLLVQTNTLLWISEDDVISNNGKDFWYFRD